MALGTTLGTLAPPGHHFGHHLKTSGASGSPLLGTLGTTYQPNLEK